MVRRIAGIVVCVALFALSNGPVFGSHIAPRVTAGDYYYNAGRRVEIHRSPTRATFRAGTAAAKTSVAELAAALPDVSAVRDIRAGGVVEVTFDAPALAGRAPASRLRDAVGAEGVEVFPVFFEPGTESDTSTLFIQDDLLVQFRGTVSRSEIDRMNALYGAEVVESLGYAANGYRLRVTTTTETHNALTVANAFFESGACVFAHPNFLASRSLRTTPNDPEFLNQWHLLNTGQGSGTPGADVKANLAWDITLGSPSVTVAVADTGIDYHHADFDVDIDGVAKVTAPRDVVHQDDDPFPQPGDASVAHGTSAAGVAIAASDNGYATCGVAPKCRLMPIQLYAESTFTPNATEADAFLWAADHGASVMSNSWGPDNNDTPLPDATRAAIDYATTNGRGGKGMVIFFAAGNSSDDTIHDNYVNYPRVVAVAASTNFDTRANYSRFGDAISIAAPSNGGSLSITTSDVTGPAGYSSGDFTSNFGGTSSACPLAAGVAALVLSVNPDLTWSEVKSVLEETADKIDPGFGAYDAGGHSIFYGYGRVNAAAAVDRALELYHSDQPRVAFVTPGGLAGAGATVSLTWDAGGPNPIASQHLAYSTDGGATFNPISDVAAGSLAFDWAIPDAVTGQVDVRISVTDTEGKQAFADDNFDVWARPVLATAKVKRSASGTLSLVVDGTAIRVGEAQLFIGAMQLGDVKFPAGRQVGDGTTTRIVSKDRQLKSLVPNGATVLITVRHPSTGQVSNAFSYTR